MIKKFTIKNNTYYKLIIDDCELIFCTTDEIEKFLQDFDYDTKYIKKLMQNTWQTNFNMLYYK